MKITQDAKFQPVTILLESEEELNTLRTALGVARTLALQEENIGLCLVGKERERVLALHEQLSFLW